MKVLEAEEKLNRNMAVEKSSALAREIEALKRQIFAKNLGKVQYGTGRILQDQYLFAKNYIMKM